MKTENGQWNPVYPNIHRAEGWGIFETGMQDASHNPYELQKYDEDDTFGDDAQAQRFVFDKAIQGSKPHLQALFFLCRYSPNEVDSIIRESVGHLRLENFLKQHNIKL